MRRIFFSLGLISFLFLVQTAFPATYYVKKDGNDSNDGSKWTQAFLTTTKAMDEVTSGDAVWVAKGEYKEGATITVREGVTLYGGFDGTETKLSQRDVDNNQVIIDGENSCRCVTNLWYD